MNMKVKEVISVIEDFAPLSIQEVGTTAVSSSALRNRKSMESFSGLTARRTLWTRRWNAELT